MNEDSSFSMSLRHSARRAVQQSQMEYESGLPTGSLSSPPAGRNRKRVLVDTSTAEDTPGSGGAEGGKGSGRGRVKRVKKEPLLKHRRGPGRRRSPQSARHTHNHHSNHPHFPARRSSRLSKDYYDEEGGRERAEEGEEEEDGPVRRSKRERRLVFASFNLSEINRQLHDPHHGFPIIDDSEDDLEPYEKLLSPHRASLLSKRACRTTSQLGQSSKAGAAGEQGCVAAKVEEEKGEGRTEEEEKEEEEEEEDEEEEGEESSESDDEDEDNSRSEDEGVRGYFLRKRRPVIYQYQPVIQVVEDEPTPKKSRPRRSGPSFYNKSARSSAPRAYQPRKTHRHTSTTSPRKKTAHHDSSTTTSGSDSDEARFRRRKSRSMQKARMQCLPMNFVPEDVNKGVIRDRARIGSSLADVDPMNIDQTVTFESVGGLKHHIRALKEMIIFPLLYPEVFDRFKIQPPRGVLFYGPPGCGKTLLARALANECSKGGKKVAFFMRKGADCLSKWVGESERQLRLLFDQAYQMRPSIIFFDEIDGLAPVRSSRQDQIHSSIVSTLLALMDGLDSRGEVVIIGATNRIDAIDPALRRPGRFDREFLFPLPSREDRRSILSIHTRQWHPPLKPDFLTELADLTVGYCGADLRALCTEASLCALRRRYPQIYQTTDKLVLDVSKINVAASDFHNGLKAIVPTAQRSDVSVACALPEHVRPLFLSQFQSLLSLVSFVFPPSWKAVSRAQTELKKIFASEEMRHDLMHACIDEMSNRSLELSRCEASTQHQASASGSGGSSQTCLNRSLNVGTIAVPRNAGTALPGSVGILSKTRVKPSNVMHQRTKSRCKSDSDASLVDKVAESSSVSSLATPLLNSTAACKGTSDVLKFGSALVSSDCDLCQLSQCSQPAAVEEVYFDTNETVLETEEDEAESILISQSSPTSQSQESCASVPHATSTRRFLTLSTYPHTVPLSNHPRLVLCGPKGMGQTTHLGPALLHTLEDFPMKILDLPVLFASSTKTPEESCTQVFREARRTAPSVIFIPRISSWWDVTTETFQAMFLSALLSLPSSTPLLVLATSECPWSELPSSLREVFKGVSNELFVARQPSLEQRQLFFFPVLLMKPTQPPPPRPKPQNEVEFENLPVAPPPKPRELTQEELRKMGRQREAVLRELRVFLRDATNKLLAERKFKEFVNAVNSEEVPDYYDIILEPMDLGTIMKKIDEHRYTTPRQWITDVDLIARNALEYNPEHDSESRLLRHRAVALQDMAHSILDHELSEDFEKQCEDIEETHQRLGGEPSQASPVGSSSIKTTAERSGSQDVNASPTNTSLLDPPRRSLRQKGINPIVDGLPYYAPAKPRTPRKHDDIEGAEGNLNKSDNVSNNAKGICDEVVGSKVEEKIHKRANSAPDAPSESRNESTAARVEQSGWTPTEGESVPARINGVHVERGDEEPPKHRLGGNSKSIYLKNSQVKRKIFREEPSSTQQQPSESTLENSSLSASRYTKRSSSVPVHAQNGSLEDSAVEIFMRNEDEGSMFMETSPLTTERMNLQQNSNDVGGVNLEEGPPTSTRQDLVVLDRQLLLGLFERVAHVTEGCSVEQMEALYSTLEHLAFRHRMKNDRGRLLEDMEMAVDLFVRSC